MVCVICPGISSLSLSLFILLFIHSYIASRSLLWEVGLSTQSNKSTCTVLHEKNSVGIGESKNTRLQFSKINIYKVV